MEVIDASDVDPFPLRLKSWVFCVNGGNDIVGIGELSTRRYK